MTKAWRIVPMGELCSISSGDSDTQDAVTDGPYVFFDRSKTIKRSSRFLYDCEALIIPGEGKEFLPKQFKGKFDLHQRAYALFNFVSDLDVRFLYHFLHYRSDYFPSVAVGATVKSLRRRHFENFPVPIPSLHEQQRIVAILDKAFEGIATAKANAERNFQNARALFESHLHSVFTQRGDGWVEKTIGETCILRSGTTLPKEIERSSGEIPYLKVADMNINENLNGVCCSSRYVNKADVNASNLLPVGTTIFPKRGGAILTNKKRLTKRVICTDLNIMGVTPKSGLLPEFLFNFFLKLDLRDINNGSSIPQINNYSIEPLVIAFPKSIAEQQAIIAKLNSFSETTKNLEVIYQQKLERLEALKKSLLHQAFTGSLEAKAA